MTCDPQTYPEYLWTNMSMERLLSRTQGAHMMRGPVFGIDLMNLASNEGARRGEVAFCASILLQQITRFI